VSARAGEPPALRRAQWRVLIATSACYLCYYVGRQNFGWAIKGMRDDLNLTNTQIGWISGTSLVCYGAGQIWSGRLGDRFGGRRMVALGAVLSCGFNWLTSFAQGFASLMLAWCLNSLAQSLGFAPASRLIANWWGRQERGRAYGIFNFAAGFSSVLAFALSIAVLQVLSWPWVFRLPALLLPVAGVALFWLVRDRPEELGFATPPGCSDEPGEGGGKRPAPRPGRDRWVLGSRRFLLACLGFGLDNWARLGLLVWVPVHFLRTGDASSAVWITLSLPIGMALGALATGYLGDRVFQADHPRLIALLLGLAGVTALTLALVPREQGWLWVSLLFLAGFLVFGPVSPFLALGTELLGTRATGTGLGVMNAAGYGTAALGDLAFGRVLDVTGRTESIFVLAAVACALGAVASLGILAGRGSRPAVLD
jgi:OPA family glycerol-3-phosphate transporter-like MFS transporter